MSRPVDKKINEPPSRLTQNVQNILKEMINTVPALAVDLKTVRLVKATNVEIKGLEKKPIIIYVHINSAKAILKLGKKLITQLERRLSSTVIITCKRNIQSRWIKVHKSQMRPRNRTLTAVHDSLLQELCAPANIIGRRLRVRVDGTQIHKIILDKSQQAFFDGRTKILCQDQPKYYTLRKKKDQ